jgi:hypothetical protein
MLHQATQAALHPRVRMTIEMAPDGGAFVHLVDFIIDPNHS